jgi:hypothetical protein
MLDPNADPTTTLNEAQPTNVFADPFGNDNYAFTPEKRRRSNRRFYESQTSGGLDDPFGNDAYRPDNFFGAAEGPGSRASMDWHRRHHQPDSYRDIEYDKPVEQADYDRFDAFIEERRERSRRAAEAEAQRVREMAPQTALWSKGVLPTRWQAIQNYHPNGLPRQ